MHKLALIACIRLDLQTYLFLLYPWDRVPDKTGLDEGRFVFIPVSSGLRPWGWWGIVKNFSLCFGGPGCRESGILMDSGFLFALLSCHLCPQPVYGATTLRMSHSPSFNHLEMPLRTHLHVCGSLLGDCKSSQVNNEDEQSPEVNCSWPWSIYSKPTCRRLTFVPLFKL